LIEENWWVNRKINREEDTEVTNYRNKKAPYINKGAISLQQFY